MGTWLKIWHVGNDSHSNKVEKVRVRGLCFQFKTSEKYWAHLAKFEVLGIVDFWQFCKKVQLQQCITPRILNFWRFSWTF